MDKRDLSEMEYLTSEQYQADGRALSSAVALLAELVDLDRFASAIGWLIERAADADPLLVMREGPRLDKYRGVALAVQALMDSVEEQAEPEDGGGQGGQGRLVG